MQQTTIVPIVPPGRRFRCYGARHVLDREIERGQWSMVNGQWSRGRRLLRGAAVILVAASRLLILNIIGTLILILSGRLHFPSNHFHLHLLLHLLFVWRRSVSDAGCTTATATATATAGAGGEDGAASASAVAPACRLLGAAQDSPQPVIVLLGDIPAVPYRQWAMSQ